MHEPRRTPQQIARYRSRLSGPLRDRRDLTVEVPAVPPDILTGTAAGESSASVRTRVVAARDRQRLRYESEGIRTNAEVTPALMERHCGTDAAGMRLFATAIARTALSARVYDCVRKVARTTADLTGAESISIHHIAEAATVSGTLTRTLHEFGFLVDATEARQALQWSRG